MNQPPNSIRPRLPAVRRVVVKLGSAVLAPGGELDAAAVARLAADIGSQAGRGVQIAVVSSGAVASGFRALGLTSMPKAIVHKQAAAAVGQQRLMACWAGAFAGHGRTVAQVLLTAEDLAHRPRLLNARRTLEELLTRGVVPIINENDSVSYDEIKLGDNDRLSALVAGLIQADLLLVLSGISGLYAGGDAKRIVPHISNLDEARAHVQTGKSEVGTGGMATKIAAASIAGDAGIPMVIAGGGVEGVVSRVLRGEPLGTLFELGGMKKSARQRWLGQTASSKGVIIADEGAKRAIVERGASLLPSGVIDAPGSFEAGATVEVRSAAGEAFARGVSAYSAGEIRAIRGKRSTQIAPTLGYCYSEEIIHRNDLALIAIDRTDPKDTKP